MVLSPNCTYQFLKAANITQDDACEKIGRGICAKEHYFNMYEAYYCNMGQSAALYFLYIAIFFSYMMVNLNYIRRTYYIQHIQRVRHILNFPQWLTESVLVPLSYGVIPIFIRILASIKKLDFTFQSGANIGACFNLITLFTGLCAMKIGLSPKVDMQMFVLNMIFVFIGSLMHLPLGSRKVVNDFDAILYLLIFGIYLLCRFFLAKRNSIKEEEDKKRALIEGKEIANPSATSIMAGLRIITEFLLKVEAAKIHEKEAKIAAGIEAKSDMSILG